MKGSSRWDFNYTGQQKLKEMKIELCHILILIQTRDGHTPKMMAAILGTSRANVSLVTGKKVNQLTLNQLFRYLITLRPHFRFLISV